MKLISAIMAFCCIFVSSYAQSLKEPIVVTPEDFGCISNDLKEADGNSVKMQKMIDYAIKNGFKIVSRPDKSYYISKSLVINNPVSIDFNRAKLIATDSIDMIVVSRTNGNCKLYHGNISGLVLNLNKIAKSGLNLKHVVKIHVNECWIIEVPQNSSGIIVGKGSEMFFDNIHIEGGEDGSTGFMVNTSDCHFTDCAVINCQVAVNNKGSNLYERIHAWIERGSCLSKSVFFKIGGKGPIFLHQCFSDTFEKVFDVDKPTKLFVSQHRNYHNLDIWKKNKKELDSYFIRFANKSIADNSRLFITDSFIGGLFVQKLNKQEFSNYSSDNIVINNSIRE